MMLDLVFDFSVRASDDSYAVSFLTAQLTKPLCPPVPLRVLRAIPLLYLNFVGFPKPKVVRREALSTS